MPSRALLSLPESFLSSAIFQFLKERRYEHRSAGISLASGIFFQLTPSLRRSATPWKASTRGLEASITFVSRSPIASNTLLGLATIM